MYNNLTMCLNYNRYEIMLIKKIMFLSIIGAFLSAPAVYAEDIAMGASFNIYNQSQNHSFNYDYQNVPNSGSTSDYGNQKGQVKPSGHTSIQDLFPVKKSITKYVSYLKIINPETNEVTCKFTINIFTTPNLRIKNKVTVDNKKPDVNTCTAMPSGSKTNFTVNIP